MKKEVTPQLAVTKLAEIMAAMPTHSETAIYDAMDHTDIPHNMAHLAFRFTQIAWGRLFLDGLGIRFSADYWCLDADGNMVESGLLADNPYFTTAVGLAQKYNRTPAFKYTALTSWVVNTINAALKNGSKPEHLAMTPDAIFLQAATSDGLKKLQQLMSDYVDTNFRKRGS